MSRIPRPVVQRLHARSFKSLRDAEVELGPLSVMVGANSSGKSSLVQVLLLLAQAQRQTPAEATVALNGRLVQLGDLAALRSHGADRDTLVEVGATLALDGAPAEAAVSLSVDWSVRLRTASDALHGAARVAGVEVRLDGEADSLLLEFGEAPDGLAAKRDRYERARERGLAEGPRQLVEYAGTLRTSPSSGPAEHEPVHGVRLRGAFPSGVLVQREETSEFLTSALERAARQQVRRLVAGLAAPSARPRPEVTEAGEYAATVAAAAECVEELLNGSDVLGTSAARLDAMLERVPRESLAELVGELRRRGLGDDPTLVPAEGDAIERLRGASAAVTAFLERHVWYLGANRQRGTHLSQIAVSGSPTDIGVAGEHVASVLRAYSEREVRHCPLAEAGDTPPGTLADAVNYWARNLGLIADYDVLDYGAGTELRVATQQAGEKIDLAHVGAGVGALLPVIVVCLLAEPGAVIALEEPELHLHPAIQQRLADFFLACAQSGRQLIVETHSDTLVTRLRRRVAEDETEDTLNLVSILFAELTDGATQLETVPLNKYGGLDEWPHGFFDEQADDAESILITGGARLAAELNDI
jgi:predicted ATPase